jgi:hypothetical protein
MQRQQQLPVMLFLAVLTVMVQCQGSAGQLPLRIDVTWFEHHDRWQQQQQQQTDAFSDSNNNNAADASDAVASDEEETDRHTQQAS